MKFPFLGGAYEGKSKHANPQQCVNLYLEPDLNGGRPALVKLSGLEREVVIPNLEPTYADDYANLKAFADSYDHPDGVTFTLTSDIDPATVGLQNIAGVLSGLSTGYDKDGICLSQKPTAAGALTFVGGASVISIDPDSFITITSTGSDFYRVFTITGANKLGETVTETIGYGLHDGPNANTLRGLKKFMNITSVTVDAATAGNIEIGYINDLYWDEFALIVYSFTDKYNYCGLIDIVSNPSSYSGDIAVTAGVKVVRLERFGIGEDVYDVDATDPYVIIIKGERFAKYPVGSRLYWPGRIGIDPRCFTVTAFGYNISTKMTHITVAESFADSASLGYIQAITTYGEAYRNRGFVRSLNCPRGNGDIASGGIAAERYYQVVGYHCTVTYNDVDYGYSYGTVLTAGDTYLGVDGVTVYEQVGVGIVIDKTAVDLYALKGHKTNIKDQALALIAACTHGTEADAAAFLVPLLKCQYPLSNTGVHDGDYGMFADVYYTHGHSTYAGQERIMAVNPCFRTGSMALAAYALLFYYSKYPAGTADVSVPTLEVKPTAAQRAADKGIPHDLRPSPTKDKKGTDRKRGSRTTRGER